VIFLYDFFKYPNSSYYNLDVSNFDMWKAFIEIPASSFVFCLALYWVIDGFRRSRQVYLTEPSTNCPNDPTPLSAPALIDVGDIAGMRAGASGDRNYCATIIDTTSQPERAVSRSHTR